MRKRSGAIHSQTEQQFILVIGIKALNKNGIFYDQKFNQESQSPRSINSQKQNENNRINPFVGFDFNQVKQFEKDEQDLNQQIQKQKPTSIKNVVICDKVEPIVSMLSVESHQRTQGRQVDLVVRKLLTDGGKTIVIKYWVIEYSMIQSPLAQIYISSAVNLFWVSNQHCKMKNSQTYQVQQLKNQIFKYQSKLKRQ